MQRKTIKNIAQQQTKVETFTAIKMCCNKSTVIMFTPHFFVVTPYCNCTKGPRHFFILAVYFLSNFCL